MSDPEVVNDPTPGLRTIKRKSGRLDLYWVADPAAVKAGYEPRTVRLHGDMSNPIDRQSIAARCRVLTASRNGRAAGLNRCHPPRGPSLGSAIFINAMRTALTDRSGPGHG